MASDPPQTLGPYRVLRRLGAGGMGEVLLAHDPRLARRVAIKRILPDFEIDGERRARFQREARLAAQLNHPAIVHVHDLLSEGGVEHIVMEVVEGTSLRHAVEQRGRLPPAEGLAVAVTVAEGLAYAHRHGVVHRDLKTENVLLTAEGEAKIVDFGLARLLRTSPGGAEHETLTEEGATLGTYRSMAPEQLRGDPVDGRADLFSFGVLLYEIFTGRSPFRADTAPATISRVLSSHQTPARELCSDLPAGLSELIEHLLEKQPALRPRDAEEVARRLRQLADGTAEELDATAAHGDDPTPPTAETVRRLRTLVISDLERSTELVARLGDRRATDLGARHDHAARALLDRHGGREIDKSDGFLLLFERPIEAVSWALGYHEALAELSREAGVELRSRVGIHLGEVYLRENRPREVRRGAKPIEVEGLAKATAARLMALAGGGQTLLTRGAFELAQRATADDDTEVRRLRWVSHGLYRLKGVEEPLEVCEVGIEGVAPLSPPADIDKASRVAMPAAATRSAPTAGRAWRRWLAAAAILAAVAGGLVVSLREPSVPISVAVLKPRLVESPESEDTALLAFAMRSALLRGLASLEGISAKSEAEVDEVPGPPTAVARAVGADEALDAQFFCKARSCWVTLSRIRVEDGSVEPSGQQEVPLDDPLIVDRVVTGLLLQDAYQDRHQRSGADELGLPESSEDYGEYLEIARTFRAHPEAGAPDELLQRLADLRGRSRGFVDAHLLESQIDVMRFYETQDRRFLDAALERVTVAKELAPGYPEVYWRRFEVEVELERFFGAEQTPGAEEALRKLEALVPGDSRTLGARARLEERRGKLTAALELWRRHVERQPSWGALYNSARLASMIGRLDEARESLEQLFRLHRNHYDGLSLLAEIELKSGAVHRAVEVYGELATRSPGMVELTNLGVARMLLGNYHAAAQALEQAAALSPDHPVVLLNLADVRLLQNRRTEADSLYGQVLELVEEPGEDCQLLTIRAQALAHMEKKQEAVEVVSKALRLAPEDGAVAFEAAVVHALVGEDIHAVFNAKQAVQLGYDQTVWFELPWFDGLRKYPEFIELTSSQSR